MFLPIHQVYDELKHTIYNVELYILFCRTLEECVGLKYTLCIKYLLFHLATVCYIVGRSSCIHFIHPGSNLVKG